MLHAWRSDSSAGKSPTTIVHDLDLKDGKFGAPEGSTVSTLIEGLQLAHADDAELLTHWMALFDVLYR
jgi:hypothetical protein